MKRVAIYIRVSTPLIGKVRVCKHLEMVTVADLFACIDVNPDRFHWSLLSFRFPQCLSLRVESNFRSTFRFNARMTPIRANIVGPPNSATSIRLSIAASAQTTLLFAGCFSACKKLNAD
jgi:hypothetical protein